MLDIVSGKITRKYKLSEESKQKSEVMRTLNFPLFSKCKTKNEERRLVRIPGTDFPSERPKNNPKYKR
jgi:hypothetical protein